MLHGVERYEIVGEGLIEGALAPGPPGIAGSPDPLSTPAARHTAPLRTFCRIFPKAQTVPSVDALKRLGEAMEQQQAARDSTIAAGFTYFGQFVDHDMTFDQTELTIGGAVDPSATVSHRSPALDLDSVYGGGPTSRPDLYEADGASLKIGICSESEDQNGVPLPLFPNDLLRVARKAVIADPRNDENLALAQLHLAFLKFHNSFVEEFRAQLPALDSSRLFLRAREATIKHYQRIVLHEFLPRVIDLEFVLSNGHRFFKPQMQDHMPIEFSVAAFRMGHSMIRPAYEWNRVFNTKPSLDPIAPATLTLLFEFTQFSGSTTPTDPAFLDAETLPSNWPVDWRLMFDVVGHPPPSGFEVNRAQPIDTWMTDLLSNLPEFAGAGVVDKALLSLARRNLLRGRLVGLCDGLTVAGLIAASGLPHDTLTEDQLKGGPHGHILEEEGLLEAPPLWYYILREAELQMERLPNGKIQGGARLGPVGSAIVAETIVAHIRKADVSILADGTIQHLHQVPAYTMSDLLLRVNDLNPVG